MVRFVELDEASLRGARLIVDVDGTLVHDEGAQLDDEALAKLRSLAAESEVYLCSNGPDRARLKAIAEAAGVSHIETIYRKPNARVMESLPQAPGRRTVVIGDKRLTDGRFARKLGAEFVQVERLRHAGDRFHIRLMYFADDVAAYIALMRPAHWVKNLLVFAPLFFAHDALRFDDGLKAFGAFTAFSLFASAIYVLNDFADRAQDALHPVKRRRPLASGAVSARSAVVFFAALFAGGTALLALIPAAAPAILGYAALNVAYSFFLKRIVVADILSVAVSYPLRVIAGGAAAAVAVSPWIVSCTFFGALTLVAGKRLAEYAHARRRPVLAAYSERSLKMLLVAASTLAILTYAIWSVVAAPSPLMMYSTLFVALALFRVVNLIMARGSEAEQPEVLVFKDPVVLGAFLSWAAYTTFVFYVL